MKIQESGQYYMQYNGLGSKGTRNSSKEEFFVESQNGKSDNNNAQQLGSSKLASFIKINSSMMPSAMGISGIKTVNTDFKEIDAEQMQKETLEYMEETGKIFDEKIKKMNSLLGKLGINGEVGGACMETVPQKYTMYYVETGDKQNTVIIELENGELIFGKTSQDSEKLFRLFDIFRDENGFNKAKFNVEELKDMFMNFLDSFDKKGK